MQVDATNNLIGDLKGFYCDKCNNKGWIAYLDESGEETTRTCDCVARRISLKRIKDSGLNKQLTHCTFENYWSNESWQQYVKDKAMQFLTENEKWFFIGGQVGSGKTHICVAIVGEKLKTSPVQYMLWKDESARIKASVNDTQEFNKLMKPLKTSEVLYIDDFFKGGNITAGDINIAFEILNARYNNDLQTIISSEMSLTEITAVDEAIGSRIKEKAKDYVINLGKDEKKNFRFKT